MSCPRGYLNLPAGRGAEARRWPRPGVAGRERFAGSFKLKLKLVSLICNACTLGLPVPGDIPGPPGDIPGRAGTLPKKVGDIPATLISPTPRRGYPRPPGTSRAASGISPAARGYPRPRRGCPRSSGTSPACGGGHPRPARGYPRPFGGCPARVLDAWCRTAHTQVNPHTRSKPTQQHVKRCLCDTTRQSESSRCAAVAAARAALVPGGEARTSEPHSEARRGVRRAESPSDHRVPLWRALFDRAEEPPRPGQREQRGRCGRPPSRRACGTGRSVAEACASKETRPGAVESWRRQPARAHAGCREPPSLAAHDADEWTGREPTRSRPTAWCRAALEPRRSARTPSGRRPSQPPARRLNRTASVRVS